MVAFRGSIDPIGAHELLRRVAAHDDPGMLTISYGSATHVVWIGHGDIVCAAPDAPADVVARILDGDGGTFLFEADRAAPRPGVRVPFAETLELGRSLHDELAMLVASVPSPMHQVRWRARLASGPIEIDAETWSLLVAITSTPTTTATLADRAGSELLARRAVRGLVESGLVEVFEAEVPSPVIVPERSARPRPADLDVDPDLEFAMLPPADLFFSELPSSTEDSDDPASVAGPLVLVEVAGMDRVDDLAGAVDRAAALDVGDLSEWQISEDNLVIDESGWATSRPLAPSDDEIDAPIDRTGADVDVDDVEDSEAWASDGWGDDAWSDEPAPSDDAVGWGDEEPAPVRAAPDVGWEGDGSAIASESAAVGTVDTVDEVDMVDEVDTVDTVDDWTAAATTSAAVTPAPAGLAAPTPAAETLTPPVVAVPAIGRAAMAQAAIAAAALPGLTPVVPPPPAPVVAADQGRNGNDAGGAEASDDELLSRAQIYRFLSSMRS